MKLGKIVLSTLLLAVCAASAFAFGKANVKETSAMTAVSNDPDLDVGLNVHRTETTDWQICQFYINTFESTDVSGGNYIAVRMKGNTGTGTWFDFIPNVNDNAARVKIDGTAAGIKCIPAVPQGEAWPFGGVRNQDLPMNFQEWDVWFCIPKTEFARSYFGGDINWSQPLWAFYFMFYGNGYEVFDIDIGNIYTANIDANGHLVKVNRLVNWANMNGVDIHDSGMMSKLGPTRNNESLKPAVKFIQAIENVDACSTSAAEAAYAANKDAYAALDTDNLAYLDTAIIGDHAAADPTSAKTTSWTATQKWDQICALAGHPNKAMSPISYNDDKRNPTLAIALVTSISLLTVSALVLLLVLKKRKAQ